MLAHLNREGGVRQQSSFSSMLMSVFSRGEATAPEAQPQYHPTGNSTTFHNVLEVGVGSNVVKLTLSEGGLKTERVDALGKNVIVQYGLTKIEWYAVDDTTGELLIQYHEFNTDDKYQVAFRSPQYRAIWDCFCYYLCRKGEKLERSQKEKELRNQMAHEEDAIAPPLPSPGGSPAVLPAHQNRPTSGDHHYHQPTNATASPSVGRSSLRNGPTTTNKKKMPPVHFSPRISMTDSPNLATSSSPTSSPHGTDEAISCFDAPLIVLPPPPRNRSTAATASPCLGRVALPPGPLSPSFSAFPQSPTGSFDMPALPSPGLSAQRRSTTTTSGLPPKPAEAPTPSAPAFDLINW